MTIFSPGPSQVYPEVKQYLQQAFEEGVLIKQNGKTQLDLGGIAKGLAVDLLVERLNDAGFPSVFVEWEHMLHESGLYDYNIYYHDDL